MCKGGYRHVTSSCKSAVHGDVTKCKILLRNVTAMRNIVPFHENFIIFKFAFCNTVVLC